ncbi:MAG: DUF5778 family protein [Haloarculaceae archaeon]
MADAIDEDLYRRALALLEPGEIELVGVIVHTELDTSAEPKLHQLTLEAGDVIAEGAGVDPTDTYVHSGNDDPDFGLNQHQGLTLDGDEFVWECQQLLREGTYDVVFYYEASADQEEIVGRLRAEGHRVTPVP